MEGQSLRSRAFAFAIYAGTVAFALAMLAGTHFGMDAVGIRRALVVALVCATLCWASAERAVAGTATAVDAVTLRMGDAARGDLVSPLPACIDEALPELGAAMDGMFARMREHIDRINAEARHDPVTALANRVHFRERAEAAIAALPPGAAAVLLFIDLDRFKAVNDGLGHAIGDALLRLVADRLVGAAREMCVALALPEDGVTVARLAGDEFTLLFAGTDAADALAERMIAALDAPFVLRGRTIEIGASIGAAVLPFHGEELSALMRAADRAMYHAKALGRGRMQVFAPGILSHAETRETLERNLALAIARDEIGVRFAPQIDLRGGRIEAVQSMIYWRAPDGGEHSLDAALAMIEDEALHGAAYRIGAAAMMAAIERWRGMGHDLRLIAAASSRVLEASRTFTGMGSIWAAAGFSAAAFELEISETVAMAIGCGGRVFDELAAARAEGLLVSIGEFGSGYSNIPQLSALPVDSVRLAPALVAEIVGSPQARRVMHALIALVHSLDCRVVAAGVDDPAQIEILRVIGCDAAQGAAIGAFGDAESIARLLGPPPALAASA